MKQKCDSLGDRMKGYEHSYRFKLPRRMPVIIRLDGKSFGTFTKQFKRPFDDNLMNMMNETAKYLCENIQGAQIAYIQSDEINILIHNYKKLNSEAWFDNNIQKMTSISAGMASGKFTLEYLTNFVNELGEESKYLKPNEVKPIIFDSRVFILPESEVNNCFVWRQQDATRNSIQMVGQSKFSHSQLNKKSCNDIQEMLFQHYNINWNDYATQYKRGRCIVKNNGKWKIDNEIPLFNKETNYINDLLLTEE